MIGFIVGSNLRPVAEGRRGAGSSSGLGFRVTVALTFWDFDMGVSENGGPYTVGSLL